MRYDYKGQTIGIKLPDDCGHAGYSVECIYKFDREKQKYLLNMKLCRDDIGDTLKIDSQEINSQYISSTKDDVSKYICKIVEQASLSGYFQKYIDWYEYTFSCFDRGNALFEIERLGEKSNDKETA